MKFFASVLLMLLALVPVCQADSGTVYRQSVALAAHGEDRVAIATLAALVKAAPVQNIWRQRAQAALLLIRMRMAQQTEFPAQSESNHPEPNHTEPNHTEPNLALASAYAANHPYLQDTTRWPATVLAVIFPGGGHAWQGRWRDASMAAMMVWPMLILTFWAAKRRMGPVTVFFALITIWLWSGTVFSSISLAERSNAETYMAWWQGIWQASGLPGRPW